MCFLRMAWLLLVLSFFIILSLENIVYADDDSKTPADYDRDVLIAFKNNITGDVKGCTHKLDDGDACTWITWITCNTDNRVTEIHLGGCDISVSLSLLEELGKLRGLTHLFLNGNRFLGPIPPAFGNLTNLVILDISRSLILGEIPGELGLLPNLNILNLSGNALEGKIPRELGNLESLLKLNLDDNCLEGSIPFHELSNLKNLNELDLSSNNLNGEVIEDLPYTFPKVIKVNLTNNHGLSGQVGLVGDCTNTSCCYDPYTRGLVAKSCDTD